MFVFLTLIRSSEATQNLFQREKLTENSPASSIVSSTVETHKNPWRTTLRTTSIELVTPDQLLDQRIFLASEQWVEKHCSDFLQIFGKAQGYISSYQLNSPGWDRVHCRKSQRFVLSRDTNRGCLGSPWAKITQSGSGETSTRTTRCSWERPEIAFRKNQIQIFVWPP